MKERATGRTTRLVDKYIQEFFTNPTGESVYIKDHYNSVKSDIDTLQKVVFRLKSEHPGVKYTVDRVTNSIMRMS